MKCTCIHIKRGYITREKNEQRTDLECHIRVQHMMHFGVKSIYYTVCVSYAGGFALLRRFYTKSKEYYIPWRLQHSRNNKISISVGSEISASQPHYRPRRRSPSLDGPRASSLRRAPGVGRSIPGRAGTAGRRGPGRRVTRQQQPQQQQQQPRMMSRQQ